MKTYDGNRAKIGGVITYSNDATQPVGRYAWFQVFDLGKWPRGPADRSSLIGFGDEAANEAFCNSPNLPDSGRGTCSATHQGQDVGVTPRSAEGP